MSRKRHAPYACRTDPYHRGSAGNTAIVGKVLNVANGILPLQTNEDGIFGTATYTEEECDIPEGIEQKGNRLVTETLRLMPTANGFLPPGCLYN